MFLRYAERLRAGGDSMSASAIGESEDVVRIMTTHKTRARISGRLCCWRWGGG